MTDAPRSSAPAPPATGAAAPRSDERRVDRLRSAARDPASWARFLAVAVGGLALDLWSKTWAFDTLGQTRHIVLIDHVLEFHTMLNAGALFGVGRGMTTLFLIASVFALGLVGWMFVQTSPRRWLLQIALGGILAGALGNMYDRVFVRLVAPDAVPGPNPGVYMIPVERTERGVVLQEYPPKPDGVRRIVPETPPTVGYVRDFIKIPTRLFGKVDVWPWVFNVADMLLVGGVAILAWYLWRDRAPEEPDAAGASDGGRPDPGADPGSPAGQN